MNCFITDTISKGPELDHGGAHLHEEAPTLCVLDEATKAWNKHMYNTIGIERYHDYVLLDEEWIKGAMRSTWRLV